MKSDVIIRKFNPGFILVFNTCFKCSLKRFEVVVKKGLSKSAARGRSRQ
jgi:hypothetical protein